MSSPDDPRRARSRRRLLDAAAELLAQGGTSAVTVEAVTSLSGVARTTLYRNFSSSHALVAAAFGELLPRAEAAGTDAAGDIADRIVALARRQYALLLGAPLQDSLLAWLAMGLASEDQPDHRPDDDIGTLRREVIALYLEPLTALLEEATAAGRLSPDGRDAAIARLVGPVIVTRLIGLPPLTDEDLGRIVRDVVGGAG